MIAIIERQYLQELRDTAKGMIAGNLNPDWARAYQELAAASDRLDAKQARSTLPPEGGWKEGPPPNVSLQPDRAGRVLSVELLGRCWNSWCDGTLVCKRPSHPKANVRCNKCGSTMYLSNFKCKP